MHKDIIELKQRMANIELLLSDLIKLFLERDVGMNNELLSLKQAATYLHLSISRIYGLIYDKKLTPVQRGERSKILFKRTELNRYLKEGNEINNNH